MLVEGLWIGCTQKDLLMSFLVHEQRILDNVELANVMLQFSECIFER
jgi:hypothetical protein